MVARFVRNILFLIVLVSPGTVFAFGGTEILLKKEARVEGARTAIEAIQARNARLLRELRTVLNDKRREEERRIVRAFGDRAYDISERSEVRRKQMNADLQRFVLQYTDSPSVAQVYLRLAELYYTRANEKFAREMDEFDRYEEDNFGKPGYEERDQPELDYSESIELYREFVELFPDHPYLPEALYLLGYTLEENGDWIESANIWKRLVEIAPRGPLAPEARFRYGEFLFLEAEFEMAAEQYQKVVSSEDPVFYDKALYKLGWTQYLMEKYDAAIRTFIDLVDMQTNNTSPDGQLLSMRKESLQYVAISFAEKGGLDGLEKLMEDLGGRSYDLELFEALGQVYFDRTQYVEAASTYKAIIRRYPEYVRNPELQEIVIQIAGNLEGVQSALEERNAYVQLFGPGSTWATLFRPRQPELVERVHARADTYLYEYSLYFHARSQGEGSEADLQDALSQAIDGYQGYLQMFPDGNSSTTVVENLADIRYEQKRWQEAGDLNRRLTQMILEPEKEQFKNAAWSMMLAYRNLVNDYHKKNPVSEYLRALTADTAAAVSEAVSAEELKQTTVSAKASERVDSGGERATKSAEAMVKQEVTVQGLEQGQGGAGTVGSVSDLPNAVLTLLDASEYYVQLFPLGERTPRVLYSVGMTLMQYHQFDLARTTFLRFLRRFPKDEFVLDAIKNVAKTYIEQGQFDKLVQWGGDVLLSSLGLQIPVKEYFSGILSGAIFKDAQNFERNKQYLKANEQYARLRKEYPESEFIDEAIQNSAINYQQSAKWDDSNREFALFAETYPDNEFAPKALFQIAVNYEKYMNYPAAISAYEDLLARFPKTDQAKDALYNAATIAAKLLMLEKASALYLSYLDTYKSSDDVDEILFFAADSYFQLQEYEKAVDIYKRYLKKAKDAKVDRLVKVYYNLGVAYEALADLEEADKWNRKVVSFTLANLGGDEPINSRYAAELAFGYAMQEFNTYKAIQLRGSMEQMAASLDKKIKALPTTNEKFLEIIKFRDPLYASAALHMIGETFMSLAEMLFEAPVPEGLDEEMQELYLMELEDQAYPIEEKAFENWQKNLDNAVRLGIVNEWVIKTRNRLESVSSNVAKIKHSEDMVVSSSEFFYKFASASEKQEDYEIQGAKVVYPNLPEGSLANLQEKYTFSQFFDRYHKSLLAGVAHPDIAIVYGGKRYSLKGAKLQ